MRISSILFFVAVVILVFGLIEVLLLRFFNPSWWRIKWIRRVGLALPVIGVAGAVLWRVADNAGINWFAAFSAGVAVLTFVVLVALIFSLPVSGLIHFIHWISDKIRSRRRSQDWTLQTCNVD